MPKSIRNRTITQKARKGTVRRMQGRKNGRRKEIGRCQTDIKTFIADSIYSLKVYPVSGVTVWNNQKRSLGGPYRNKKVSHEDEAEKMYKDLMAAYLKAYKLLKGTTPNYKSLDLLSHAGKITFLMGIFNSEIVPEGFSFNIDYNENDDTYYFTIFKVLPSYQEFCVAEIGKELQRLKTKNKKLHDLFITFIATLRNSFGINAWFDAPLVDEYILREEISRFEEEMDAEDENDLNRLRDYEAQYHSYKNGEVKGYENLIKKSSSANGNELLQLCKQFNQRNPLVKLIKQICPYLNNPYSLHHFDYDYDDFYENTYLSLFEQFCIVWDVNDLQYEVLESYVDSTANEGIQDPAISLPVHKNMKELDIDWLLNGTDKFNVLQNLFRELNKVLS